MRILTSRKSICLSLLTLASMLAFANISNAVVPIQIRWILAGTNSGDPVPMGCPSDYRFCPDTITDMATNYRQVFMEKFHARCLTCDPKYWSLDNQWSDALLIHQTAQSLNNTFMKVYLSFNGRAIFKACQYFPYFNGIWYLKDNATQQPIGFHHHADDPTDPAGYYVDLTNPGFRAWYTGIIYDWVTKSDPVTGAEPIDGIMLDTSNYYDVDYCLADSSGQCGWVTELINKCGEAKVRALNDGLISLITELKANLPSNKRVFFNGTECNSAYTNCTAALIPYADGALNENFGYDGKDPTTDADIKSYIDLPYSNPQKFFFYKCNLPAKCKDLSQDHWWTLNVNARKAILRKVYSAFLASYQAGFSYFEFGDPSYTVEGELPTYGTRICSDSNTYPAYESEVTEMIINFGQPTGPYYLPVPNNNYVFQRDFASGTVVSNWTDSKQPVTAARRMQQISCSGCSSYGQYYNIGDTIDIPARDGVWLKFTP